MQQFQRHMADDVRCRSVDSSEFEFDSVMTLTATLGGNGGEGEGHSIYHILPSSLHHTFTCIHIIHTHCTTMAQTQELPKAILYS